MFVFFFASFFYYLFSCSWRRQFSVESACVSLFLCVSSYMWIHFPRSVLLVLSTSPVIVHSFRRKLKSVFSHIHEIIRVVALYTSLRFVEGVYLGAGIAQWLERRTRDWKVAGSNPCWSGGRIFFSRVDFLCWLLFRYPFHPRVTAVARKRSRSFCQRCRWQVTAKHAYTLSMWLCMKWHGAWLYGVHRTCAETAAVSCGTSHASAVSTPLRWIFKKRAIKS